MTKTEFQEKLKDSLRVVALDATNDMYDRNIAISALHRLDGAEVTENELALALYRAFMLEPPGCEPCWNDEDEDAHNEWRAVARKAIAVFTKGDAL